MYVFASQMKNFAHFRRKMGTEKGFFQRWEHWNNFMRKKRYDKVGLFIKMNAEATSGKKIVCSTEICT